MKKKSQRDNFVDKMIFLGFLKPLENYVTIERPKTVSKFSLRRLIFWEKSENRQLGLIIPQLAVAMFSQ